MSVLLLLAGGNFRFLISLRQPSLLKFLVIKDLLITLAPSFWN